MSHSSGVSQDRVRPGYAMLQQQTSSKFQWLNKMGSLSHITVWYRTYDSSSPPTRDAACLQNMTSVVSMIGEESMGGHSLGLMTKPELT